MDLILSFVVFIGAMIAALSLDVSMVVPLLVGLAAFVLVALKRGFAFKAV